MSKNFFKTNILKLVLALLLFQKNSIAQFNCETAFATDTMTDFKSGKVIEGAYVETTLKKGAVVRIMRAKGEKYFLRLLITENFYFDKVDVLEIKSGHKSYYAEDTKQYKVNKTLGLFILEIPKNYISQLKDHGISAIDFAHGETHYTHKDSNHIKEIFECFYNTISNKKVQ